MLQQVLRRAAQRGGRPAAQRQRGEQQAHADHRAGHRQREEQRDRLAGELEEQEEGDGGEHGRHPGGKMPRMIIRAPPRQKPAARLRYAFRVRGSTLIPSDD